MKRIIVIGGGGHGCVVVDILLAMKASGEAVDPVGIIDQDKALHGAAVLGIPVLGDLERLAHVPHDAAVVAIGDNARREAISTSLIQRGEQLEIACHPSAIVGRGTIIEPGVMICAGAVVGPECRLLAGSIVNTSCSVDHHNTIGPYAHVGPGAHCGGTVSIGNGVLVGVGATILPGLAVGRGSVVGAGAVVTQDVPENVVVTGTPARVVRAIPNSDRASF